MLFMEDALEKKNKLPSDKQNKHKLSHLNLKYSLDGQRYSSNIRGINSPLDYKYVKLLRMTLKIMFFWPGELFGEKTWKISRYKGIYPIILNSLILSSIIAYLLDQRESLDFLEIGHMYLTTFLTMCSLSRSVILPLNSNYQNIILNYLTSMHLFYHANKSEYAKSMHIRMHKVCHVVCVILFIQMLTGLAFFNVIPAYLNYSNGKLNYEVLKNSTYELSVYLYIPRDATTNRNSYYFVATFNWYASYMCSSVICMNDTMLFLIVFQVYGHFKILLNLMATFPRPAATEIVDDQFDTKMVSNQMFSEAECETVLVKLKECIDYHRFLLDFTDAMSIAFGPMLLMYMTFHQVSFCLLLLECSQMSAEALIRYGPLTFIAIGTLIQISIVFEIIGTVSEKLKDAIYEMPWECMDLRARKLVLFFLMNVQNPIHIKAMGVVDVGVGTMTAILKTSVSYFTFLRTVPE